MAGVEGAILPCGTLGCCPSRRVGPWGWGVDACGLRAPGALSLEQEAPQSGPTLVPLSPGSTGAALSSARGGRSPRNADTASSPPPRASAGLSSRTAAPRTSRCPRAPSAARSRWAGHASRSGRWARGELAGPRAGPWRLLECSAPGRKSEGARGCGRSPMSVNGFEDGLRALGVGRGVLWPWWPQTAGWARSFPTAKVGQQMTCRRGH